MSPLEDPSIADGIAFGAVAGIGLVAAATMMNGVYEQKKPVITVLFGAYYTLGLMIVGALLGAWT
jgi:formate/nitrite transporter FocA (FNT family)